MLSNSSVAWLRRAIAKTHENARRDNHTRHLAHSNREHGYEFCGESKGDEYFLESPCDIYARPIEL